jgi:hypothetical protein
MIRATRRYIPVSKSSATVDAVLALIYRKNDLLNRCNRYADSVIEGLVDLGLLKKVLSKKGTFYFKTDKAKNFKAVDFAKEFLWAYHNPLERQEQNGRKLILCFDKEIEAGHGLVDIELAIKRCYI